MKSQYYIPVIALCEAINGHHKGTGDPLNDYDLNVTVNLLKLKLEWWQPSGRPYDAGVEAMAKSAYAMGLELMVRHEVKRNEMTFEELRLAFVLNDVWRAK